MISVPRKPSCVLFERHLLLGLKMKALKLSKDSSFKVGFQRCDQIGFESFCALGISQRLHLKGLSDIRDSFSLLCYVVRMWWPRRYLPAWMGQAVWENDAPWMDLQRTDLLCPIHSFQVCAKLHHLHRPILQLQPTSPPLLLMSTCGLRSLADGHPANCTAAMPWWHCHLQVSLFSSADSLP